MEPEILVVDEVLAVGDAQFQKKCLGKMGDVAKGGRTVLFVSHNIAAVSSLCRSSILLVNGECHMKDDTEIVIQQYLRHSQHNKMGGYVDLENHPNRSGKGVPCLRGLSVSGSPDGPLVCGRPALIRIRITPELIAGRPEVGFTVQNIYGQRIFSFTTYWHTKTPNGFDKTGEISCYINRLNLMPGMYSLNVAAGPSDNPLQDNILEACQFEVAPADYYGSGRVPSINHGIIFLDAEWI